MTSLRLAPGLYSSDREFATRWPRRRSRRAPHAADRKTECDRACRGDPRFSFQVIDTSLAGPQVAHRRQSAILPIFAMGKIAELQTDDKRIFVPNRTAHSWHRIITSNLRDGYISVPQCPGNDCGSRLAFVCQTNVHKPRYSLHQSEARCAQGRFAIAMYSSPAAHASLR